MDLNERKDIKQERLGSDAYLLSTESVKCSTRHGLGVMGLLESNRAYHDCFSVEKANQLFKMEKAITDMF